MEDDVYKDMHIPKGSFIFGNIWYVLSLMFYLYSFSLKIYSIILMTYLIPCIQGDDARWNVVSWCHRFPPWTVHGTNYTWNGTQNESKEFCVWFWQTVSFLALHLVWLHCLWCEFCAYMHIQTLPIKRVLSLFIFQFAVCWSDFFIHYSFISECPGKHLVDSSVWLLLVSMLATLDMSKAVDDLGQTIEPVVTYNNSIFRYVVSWHKQIDWWPVFFQQNAWYISMWHSTALGESYFPYQPIWTPWISSLSLVAITQLPQHHLESHSRIKIWASVLFHTPLFFHYFLLCLLDLFRLPYFWHPSLKSNWGY